MFNKKLLFFALFFFFISTLYSFDIQISSKDAEGSIDIINNQASAAPQVGTPVHFSIPRIGVDARVEHLGVASDGAVAAPAGAFEVSWFNAGPRPGEHGNALISGHSGIWNNGSHSIFDNLHTLQVNDTIHVTDDAGTTRTFLVQEIRIYGKDEKVPELFSAAPSANLNIITCHGTYLKNEGTYDQRLVVTAILQ